MSPFSASNLVDLLQERALQTPDRTAFIFLKNGTTEDASLTYGTLHQKAVAIAIELQTHLAVRSRVLLIYPPGLEFITAFLGCLYGGIIPVPVYPPRAHRGLSKLASIATNAEISLVLTTTALLPDLVNKSTIDPTLKFRGSCLATDRLTNTSISVNSIPWPKPPINRDSLAFLQYTSGSTAIPKGVMIRHGNIMDNAIAINHCFGSHEDSIGVSWLPPYHDMGLIGGILQPVFAGLCMILMSPTDFLQKPLHWLQAISTYQATISGGPNFAYDWCLEKISPQDMTGLDLSRWQVAFNGAEPIQAQTLQRFTAKFASCGFRPEAFYPCYGMAEATLLISGSDLAKSPVLCSFQAKELQEKRAIVTPEGDRLLVSCGQSPPRHQIQIVDPDTLKMCSPGQVGEIWIAGTHVAQGYWNRPEETAKLFQAYLADRGEGPFFRTGDLGFLHQGELFVLGRGQNLIILRGRNYYPQDLEQTVQASHPALRSACGAAFTVEQAGQVQLVIVQEVERLYIRKLAANPQLVDEVMTAIRRALAETHELQAQHLVLLKTSTIPKTSSGKVQHFRCREKFLAGTLETVAAWDATFFPGTEASNLMARDKTIEQTQISDFLHSDFLQQWLATAIDQRRSLRMHFVRSHIAQALGLANLSGIKPQQPLFDLGLDSLMAVTLKNQLETALGQPLRSTLIFDYPTLDTLVDYLHQELLAHHALSLPDPSVEPVSEFVSESETQALQQPDELENLSEDELFALLAQELD
jgi:acyl-CoA synthetase (AMP-forming)/AMP-acid ligase II/acyl carrier protein